MPHLLAQRGVEVEIIVVDDRSTDGTGEILRRLSLEDADIAVHESEYQHLRGELQVAHDASQLPELPGEKTRAALNDLLGRVRLESVV